MVRDKVTLSELQMMIRDSIVVSMPDSYWVMAEISELNINYSGHCYLELIEKSREGGNIRARARAIIWASRFRMIKPQFESGAGMELKSGISVLVKVTVDYHELYGLSLSITDIDPAYTLGDVALRRQETIRRLEQEGVIEMNRELPAPFLPKRVAVVSSSSAAGYTDFINQLNNNPYGFIFSTELYNSPMQGKETAGGIVSALNLIADRADRFDLVAIIRGGGSSSDLQWFDDYSLAFHVSQFPLPVITGIGHDKDVSVLDIVAWRSLKTPTAVAGEIVDMMLDTASLLEDFNRRLRQAVAETLRYSGVRTNDVTRRLVPSVNSITSEYRKKISALSVTLSAASSHILGRSKTDTALAGSRVASGVRQRVLKGWDGITRQREKLRKSSLTLLQRRSEEVRSAAAVVRAYSPEAVLERGFTITVLNGKAVYSSNDIEGGDHITTLFRDGKVVSRVEKGDDSN